MKKRKYHIICSWILLICFIAGQYMVYAHQHSSVNSGGRRCHIVNNQSQQTIKEKCALCDVMHHNVMVKTSAIYFSPASAAGHVFERFDYNFSSVRLILTAGRAPPVTQIS